MTVVRSRRLGRGLVAFGAVGVVLLLAAAVLVVATLGSLTATAESLSRTQTQLSGMVGPAASSLRSSATAARNAGLSLTASVAAARDAADLTVQLADSLDQLASLSSINILGTQPFAASSASFAQTAARSRSLSTNLSATADAVAANVTDATTVAADLDTLAGQLDALETQVEAAPDPPSPLALLALDILALGILGWLLVPALVALRIGWEWSREA